MTFKASQPISNYHRSSECGGYSRGFMSKGKEESRCVSEGQVAQAPRGNSLEHRNYMTPVTITLYKVIIL